MLHFLLKTIPENIQHNNSTLCRILFNAVLYLTLNDYWFNIECGNNTISKKHILYTLSWSIT